MSRPGLRALVVVDLGFGDAGKGLLVDALVRRTGASLVVRYNGGAQAGHNVVTADGRHHTFAQLGAGSFVPGVRTLLGPAVVIHPTGLWRELAVLGDKGVPDALARLRISADALVVTPFAQSLGRLRELARGAARHGSCGIGIGETVATALARPDLALRAGDLGDRPLLARRLVALRSFAVRELAALRAAGAAFDDPAAAAELTCFASNGAGDHLLGRWADAAHALAAAGVVVPNHLLAEWLNDASTVVCEGAQGVLLDQDHGFHPHTTWSDCTTAPAEALLAELAPRSTVHRIGVLRSHAVRHGAGPLPTAAAELSAVIAEHNTTGPWQGAVRHGWFDGVLARYALAVAGPLDALALTHLDLPARLARWHTCDAYELAAPGPDGRPTRLVDLPRAAPSPDLGHQQRLTALLGTVRPVLAAGATDREAVIAGLEALLRRRIDLVADGPRAQDVELGSSLPFLDR